VGFLQGGSLEAPALQTVTSSCHHCLEPACLQGCPVRAYEKDPITGIVKHLDDQCIGCQYCTLMCPYDAPKFNKARGIVRKCDMCSDRLAQDEAPACAQACPNQAISIRLVDRDAVVQACSAGGLLPGVPDAEHTLPSTVYKSARPMPRNLLPADYYRTGLEHSHPALVIMLTFTQLSVGAFGLTYWTMHWLGHAPGSPVLQSIMAILLALLALGASVFHLGRPSQAWRVFLGLRTSWLSREAIGFGLFALLGSLYGVTAMATLLPRFSQIAQLERAAHIVQLLATVMGLTSVFFSVMVYVATRRANWSATQTGIRFFSTTITLGAASVLTVYFATGGTLDRIGRGLFELIVVATLAKLALELSTLMHYREQHFSALKRVAILMLGDLATLTAVRFALALLGGVILPLILLTGIAGARIAIASGVLFALVLTAELLERYAFFRAAPASHMPGGVR
jgi:DMSO reductase anchor subunit/ferredoxin